MEPSFERLLGHGDFVRAIAQRLLRDDAAADDVVQETYALALRQFPAARWSPRAWLAGVARNLSRRRLREESRRRAREVQAARPEPVRATADIVAHEEVRRDVVAAVLALDEPYRGVVLLRFFDGLTAKDIAVRLSLPAATVRSHLRRALALLKGRLERRHGRAWGAALLPLVRPALMSSKPILPVAVLLVLLAALAAVTWWPRGTDPERSERAQEAGTAAAAVPAQHDPAERSVGAPPSLADVVLQLEPAGAHDLDLIHESERTLRVRTGVDGRAALSNEWLGETVIWFGARKLVRSLEPGDNLIRVPAGAPLHLRFLDEHGEPLGQEALQARFGRAGAPPVVLIDRLSFHGEEVFRALFETKRRWRRESAVAWRDPGAVLSHSVSAGQWSVLIDWPGSAPTLLAAFGTDGDSSATVDVALPAVQQLRIRLVEAGTGAPLIGARVTPRLLQAGFEHSGRVRRTDERGEVVLPVADKTFLEWWIETPTHARGLVSYDVSDSSVVEVPRRGHVEGRAYFADGRPASGATVLLGRAARSIRTIVREDGTYRLEGVPARPDNRIALVEDVGGRRLKLATVAVRPGETTRADLGPVPDSAALSVRLRVPGRAPGFELMSVSAERGRRTRGPAAQAAGAKRPPRAAVRAETITAHPDRDGVAQLTGLEPGPWKLSVGLGDMRIAWDEYGLFAKEAMALKEGRRRVEFTLPRGALKVRVTDERGRPIPGAAVRADPRDPARFRDRYPGYEFKPGWAAYTNRAGEALLPGLPVDAVHEVSVRAPGRALVKGLRAVATAAAPVVEVTLKASPTPMPSRRARPR